MNSQLVCTYRNALLAYSNKIVVSSTHKDKNLCFNTIYRELVYALEHCFIDKQIHSIYINECIFGIAFIVPIEDTPLIPPFSNFIHYYKKGFHKRLEKFERKFEEMNISYESLQQKRMKLDEEYMFSIIKHIELPYDILCMISSFIYIDIKKYENVRNEYQIMREKIDKKYI